MFISLMNIKPILGVVIGISLVATLGAIPTLLTQLPEADATPRSQVKIKFPEGAEEAPVVISGDNMYVTWWTNKTANNNEEIMFRASTDGGTTFGDKINLSNTTNADSTRAEIAGEGDNVIVSWWETNQTSDTPVTRISTDAGQTFGPLLMLAANGTIGEAEGTEEGE
jgi:hypothetical protein